jgi:hypothetical protein
MTTNAPTLPSVDLTRYHQPPVAVDCPDWCESEHGHPYEMEDREGFNQRWHTYRAGDYDHLSVDVTSLATWRGHHEELGSPRSRSGSTATPPLSCPRLGRAYWLVDVRAARAGVGSPGCAR